MTAILRCDHAGCSSELVVSPATQPYYITIGPNHYCCAAHAFPALTLVSTDRNTTSGDNK